MTQPPFVAFAEAPRSRVDEFQFDRYLFFGQANVSGPGPQVYVNDIDPGVELAAHFHKVDQFQVFWGSPGSIFRRHAISALMVHYTDAYSTYGPFAAGRDDSLTYATIRAQSTNFGGVMPGAREDLLYRGRRNVSVDVSNASEGDLAEAGDIHMDSVIDEEQDGLQAFLLRLGAGAQFDSSAPATTSGRSYCVVAGALRVGDRAFEPRSLGWSEVGLPSLCLTGGPKGASVLVMDFPNPPTPLAHSARPEDSRDPG
jgi:hypothetical protein